MSNSALAIDEISKSFGDAEAVKDIQLEIKEAEFLHRSGHLVPARQLCFASAQGWNRLK